MRRASFPQWMQDMVAGKMGNPMWLHLHANGDNRHHEFPPMNSKGELNYWEAIRDGAVALPDEVIAKRIDTCWGEQASTDIQHINGLLAASINVQSMRGEWKQSNKGKGKDKGKRGA